MIHVRSRLLKIINDFVALLSSGLQGLSTIEVILLLLLLPLFIALLLFFTSITTFVFSMQFDIQFRCYPRDGILV